MGSEQNRFPQQERRKRWGGCWGAFPCLGSQKGKGGKRIVPASRIPESNGSTGQANGAPAVAGLTNQGTGLAPSLLAPPSSPTSFTHSALPSTAQSPNCFLSLAANSPEAEGGPSSTIYATGPYAHETQLVSPPVFSYSSYSSTAPLTPPPELAHLTTPSSPDVPFARFLSSSADHKTNYIATNDLQATYSLYPGSPASALLSPKSTNSEHEWDPSLSPRNGEYQRQSQSSAQDANFFCPATYAQFYLDQNPPFPHNGGRLSVSKDSDVQPTGGNGHQNIHAKSPKQDVEEIEAYRASFGFSADEIITTTQYVEISDVMEESFSMTPFTSTKSTMEESIEPPLMTKGFKAQQTQVVLQSPKSLGLESGYVGMEGHNKVPICQGHEALKSQSTPGNNITGNNITATNEEDVFSRMGSSGSSTKYQMGLSCSDAEIDYRRGRKLTRRKGECDMA